MYICSLNLVVFSVAAPWWNGWNTKSSRMYLAQDTNLLNKAMVIIFANEIAIYMIAKCKYSLN